MASRMKQHQVGGAAVTDGSPSKSASGPAGLSGDFLGADRAVTFLCKAFLNVFALIHEQMLLKV